MAEETRPRRGFQQLGRDGKFLNKPNTDTQNTDDAKMRKINEDFGDMEYEYDLLPFLDSIARAGFDASRMQVGIPGKDTTSYQSLGDVVTIMPDSLADKNVQAHEYRHRGLEILMQELSLDSLEFQKKYGKNLFLQLNDLKDTIRSQSKRRMVKAGNYNQYLHEMLAELYEKPEPYNVGAGYGAADAPPFSYNREAGRATTPAEHLELLKNYSEETGNPIQKYVYPPVSVQEQMDELETDNQTAFREYLDTNPADRVESVFFKAPFEEGVKKQNQPLFETIDALSKFAEDANKKRGKRNPEDYFQVKELAQGGPVMRGIGTLNETARNMFRGPSGVGAYQQFASGGEADMSEAELKRLEALYGGSMFNNFDIPVDGKVNFRTTDDGRQMFDAEIAKTFDGERGNITPSARYSTQSGSRSMGDVVIDDDGRQIGFAIEGELYLDPDSENKLRGAIDIENSRQKRSFTFPDGEFVETKDGVLKKFNLGFDFGRLGVNFDHVEPSGQPNRTSGSATIRIGENGIFKFQDSQGKEPEYSFNYNTDVGEGIGSLNYQEDGRNDPKLGMGYTTPIGEGVGRFSYNTDGQDNELGVKYTTNFASGGEAMGPPPTRGPDPQGIGAFQKFADGGPVYMQEGGTGKDALATNHFDLIKEKYPNVDPLKISQEEGLPPQLINVFQRLLFQENQSADASAVGTSGEIGLAQLMPVTAKDVGVDRDNLIDNVRGGARYLFKMYNRFDQDPMKAVAAYNAGPTAIVDNLDRNDGQLNIGQLPSTTQSYLGFVVQPVLNQTEVAQTIDPMMAGEDLAMSMPVAQSDYLSPEAQENIRQGTQFQGGSPTGDLSIGEQIRREKFKPNVSFEGQEMEAMPVNLRDKYSSKNMQEQLVGGQETLDKGIAGLTRSLRPPFRPEEGLTRSLRPKLRPEEEEMREPQDRYPGTNTDIGEGFGIYI